MRCAACGGVYHEATGHRWTSSMVICGPCAREFIAWLRGHSQRRWGGLRFYDYTETSRNKT